MKAADRRPGPFPYYGASGIIDYVNDFLFEGLHLLIAEDGENLRTRKTPIAFLASGRYWVNNHAHVVAANSYGDTRFLAYAVESADMSGYLSGSTQPKLTQDALMRVRVVAPPFAEQRAIADILGALDDKIQSNRRLSACLRSLATTEFNEWRRAVPTVSTTFGAFSLVYGGATPKTEQSEYWGGPYPWATPTDVTALEDPYLFRTSRTLTVAGLATAATELHPAGTIFMTSRATIGAFAVSQVPCASNQGFIVVRPSRFTHRWFLFHEMARRVPDMLGLANGSTFMELSRGVFKTMPLEIPVEPTSFDQLHARVDSLHVRAANAAQESRALVALRDALLPELLSGRLLVPAAREQTGDVL